MKVKGNKLLIIALVGVTLFTPIRTLCHFTYINDQTIEVENATGDLLLLPWGGGLNAAQFNTMDLNGDAVEDLVLFDRMANQVLTYINANNSFQYAPEYESLFPTAATRFMLLRDFNCVELEWPLVVGWNYRDYFFSLTKRRNSRDPCSLATRVI